MNSIDLGWSPFFENQLAPDDRPRYSVGRIMEERKNYYLLLTDAVARCSPRSPASCSTKPTVGQVTIGRRLGLRVHPCRGGTRHDSSTP